MSDGSGTDESSRKKVLGNLPKTGEERKHIAWGGILLASMIGLIAVAVWKRKEIEIK